METLANFAVLSGWFVMLSWVIHRSSSFYQGHYEKTIQARFETLDGLRGFLALSVFMYHAQLHHHLSQTGQWVGEGASPLFHFAAGVGVSLFFMITGFLFWTKVISSEGNFNAGAFFRSRVNRLVPLYFFHVVALVVVVFVVRDFEIWDGPVKLARSILTWLAFGILGQPDINQVERTWIIDAGVVWTLAYEWAFYVALPLMAVFWRGRSFIFLVVLIFAYGYFFPKIGSISLFAYGMCAAYIVNKYNTNHFKHWGYGVVAVAAIVLSYLCNVSQFQGSGPLERFLMFIFFVLVVFGNTLFGLLVAASTKLLGVISYSLYLLQGVVMFVVIRIVDLYYPIQSMSDDVFYFVIFISGSALVLVSSITYRFVEHPFLIRR